MSWKILDLKNNISPPMRYGCSAVLLQNERIYLFGGVGSGLSSGLWCLDIANKTWEPVKTTIGKRNTSIEKCPPPRLNHTMTTGMDNSFFVFGGQGESVIGGGQLDDEQIADQNLRTRMISRRKFYNDLFEFDCVANEWIKHMPMGHAPSGRRSHTATFIQDRANKAFQLPSARTYDSDDEKQKLVDKGEVIIFGGAGENIKGFEAIFNDCWALDLNTITWEKLECSGHIPTLFEHSATLCKRQIFVIGGISPSIADIKDGKCCGYSWGKPVSDIYSLSVDTLVWSKLQIDGSKLYSIHGHTAVLDPAKDSENIIIFGGRSNEVNTDKVSIFDSSRYEMFTNSLSKSNLAPRYGHVSVSIPVRKKKKKKRLESVEDHHESDKKSKLKNKIKKIEPPSKIVDESPLFVESCVIVFGGAELQNQFGFSDGNTYCMERLKKDHNNNEEEQDDTAMLIAQLKQNESEEILPATRKKTLITKMGNFGRAKVMTNSILRSAGAKRKQNSELPFPLPWSYTEMKALINSRILEKKKAHRDKNKFRANTAPAKISTSLSLSDLGSTIEMRQRPSTSGSSALNESTLSILKATRSNNKKIRSNQSRETIHEKKFKYFKNIKNNSIVPSSRPSTAPVFNLTNQHNLLSSVDNMTSIDFHVISKHTPTISLGAVRPKQVDEIW